MTQGPVTNIGASVRQRLLNLARERGKPFDQLLQYYMDAPRVLAYAPETAIAEKFEATVPLGEAKSRMKDFYDVWLLATTLCFDGRSLAAAIAAAFSGRVTALPAAVPVTLTDSFAGQSDAQARWAAFASKPGVDGPAWFVDATRLMAAFLTPVADALLAGRSLDSEWTPGGPRETIAGDGVARR